MKQIMVLAIALVLLACLSSCSDSTTPNVSPVVGLTVNTTVENHEGTPFISIEARVYNAGNVLVHYPISCGYFVAISLRDENDVALKLHDPALVPVCPPGFNLLLPEDTLRGRQDLLWAWDENGEKYLIPPGNYTVQTSFSYFLASSANYIYLEKEMSLDLE